MCVYLYASMRDLQKAVSVSDSPPIHPEYKNHTMHIRYM